MRDPAVTQDAPTVDRAERHRAPNSERTGSRVLAPQVGCLPTGTSSEEAAMKDAPAEPTGTTTGPAELPTNPPNGRTAGVDWAKDDHVVAVVDSTGTAIDRFTVPHTGTGLAELTRHLAQACCAEVAIERPAGPVVAELLEAGLTVVVISPNQLKKLRSRYGSAGNKDDRVDAYVLADPYRERRFFSWFGLMTTTVSPASSSSATTGPSGRSIATSAQPAWARWRVSSANPVSVCGTVNRSIAVPVLSTTATT